MYLYRKASPVYSYFVVAVKALSTFFHQRRQENDYYKMLTALLEIKVMSIYILKSCPFFFFIILFPAAGKKCGKLFSLQFNISIAFYKHIYFEFSKNGHSGNKILPTQTTSIADGLSLTNIWHLYFGKKVCGFLCASYCVAAR